MILAGTVLAGAIENAGENEPAGETMARLVSTVEIAAMSASVTSGKSPMKISCFSLAGSFVEQTVP